MRTPLRKRLQGRKYQRSAKGRATSAAWRAANRAAVREYALRYAHARRDWLFDLKRKPCKDCQRLFHPACMEFDHVRGKKKFMIGPSRSLKKERVLAEIKKCDLVCSNCHRLRTWRRTQRGRAILRKR